MVNRIQFSRDFFKQRVLFLLGIFTPPVCMGGIAFVYQQKTPLSPQTILIILALVGGTFGLIVGLTWYLFRSSSKMVFEYDETLLRKISGKHQRVIPYEKLVKIDVYQTSEDHVLALRFTLTSGQKVWLQGFEHMARVVTDLRTFIKHPLQWNVRRVRLFWQAAPLWFLSGILMGTVGGLGGYGLYRGISSLPVMYGDFVRGGWQILFGVFFWVARPVSRMNPKHKILERLIGGLNLCLGLVVIVSYFLSPRPLDVRVKITHYQQHQLTEYLLPDDIHFSCSLVPGSLYGVPENCALPLTCQKARTLRLKLTENALKCFASPEVLRHNTYNTNVVVNPPETKFGRLVFYGTVPGQQDGSRVYYGQGAWLLDFQRNRKFWILYVDRPTHISGTMHLGGTLFLCDISAKSAGFIPVDVIKMEDNTYRLQTSKLSRDLYFVIQHDAQWFSGSY